MPEVGWLAFGQFLLEKKLMTALRCAALPALAALLVLGGCASREPMDYLPEGNAYMVLNMEQARSEAGTKRLLGVLQKLDSAMAATEEKADAVFLSFSGVPPGLAVYGVAIGKEGFADQAVADLKAAGGAEAKYAGRNTVTGEKFSLTPLGDNAVLLFQNPGELETMIGVSRRKQSGAAGRPLFENARQLATTASIALAVDAGPLLAAAGPQITMLSLLNQKGAEALKRVQALLVTFSWTEQPRLHASLTGVTEGRDDLAALLNSMLDKAQGAVAPQGGEGLKAVLDGVEVAPSPAGVEARLALPKEQSEEFLAKIEASATSLPSDPAERARALREALSRGRQP